MKSLYLQSKLRWRIFKAVNKTIEAYYRAVLDNVSKPLSQIPLMALDLEMTGLDPQCDQILSIGLVPIYNGMLQLEKAQHKLVSIEGSVGDSAIIHGIVDRELATATSAKEAMVWFLNQTRGHVLVAHHAPLDMCFLKTEVHRSLGERMSFLAIDTMSLERSRLLRQHDVIKEGSLRLDACRRRYGLPIYAAHNATVDALACGELLLAQMAGIAGQDELSLFDLIR
ncbi:DNA polymerase III subunit epsilon [Shewanella sp. Choline-02u-19]|uniref:exonuclease domain-containing protein n=1 Tax=unclassified Shewanella TaxID=196818 RepID=UPI000C345939|nr:MULTISPECIES: exonuclease domain-containing protein [unclassified Shewanella]PKH55872.1 DNA polymerase III subunit epsilon [Shewanella sp. Bg11-22]PKI27235.1 DNA polymerase III subunit epsilon [Shewanella sp. Choline-02u-19]